MNYFEDYNHLKDIFYKEVSDKKYDTIEIHEGILKSLSQIILPGAAYSFCSQHQLKIKNEAVFHRSVGTIKDNVHIKDIDVKENHTFKYWLFKPVGSRKAKKVTLLFHGFNEKNWDKYLPWAKSICESTQSAVILFPLAFHMQRAPKYWSDKRKMYELSQSRNQKFPNIVDSTLSNVAISMRLHAMPQRFIWSGLQTYYDVIQLLDECKSGQNQHVDKDLEVDIFAYSIGGLLAQTLKLTNHKGYFTKSKVCLFCAGAVFNRLSPVSKFILDSEANIALYSYLIEHLDKILNKDRLLNHFINEDHPEGKTFRSLLEYHGMREFREALFKKYEKHFYAISLKQDDVVPSVEIMNTLQGAYRNIDIPVEELSFDYTYSHENPFPLNRLMQDKIDSSFKNAFQKVGDFYNC